MIFRQPATARTASRQATAGGANLTIFDILQQFLAPPELPNAQTQNRYTKIILYTVNILFLEMAQRASQQYEFITQIQDQILFAHRFLFLQMVLFIQVVDTNKSSKADYMDYFQILFVRSFNLVRICYYLFISNDSRGNDRW